MNTTPEVDDQIRRVDEAQKFVKLRMLGAYDRAMEQEAKERPIRDEENAPGRSVGEIVWISDDLQIVELCIRRSRQGSEVDYYWTPRVKGKATSQLFHTIDEALLGALAIKYDGHNSQFAEFAWRMLGNK